MIDHTVNKFFETLFWIGAFLILISFFYPRWFMVTVIVGALLMIIATVREGFRLKRAKTIINLMQKNEPKVIHRLIIMLGVLAVFVYLLFKKTLAYTFLLQVYDLTIAPTSRTWWVFVLTGIIIGLILLFVSLKLREIRYQRILELTRPDLEKKKKGAVAKRIAVREQGFFKKISIEEETFWKKILMPLIERLEKRRIKKLEKKRSYIKQLRERKLEELKKKAKEEKALVKEEVRKHPLLPRALISLFIFAITIILVLHKKGKFSIEDPISAAALGVTVGLFTLYIIINIYKVSKEKRAKEEKQEKKVLQMIKEEVIAKASKYETDFDKLYKLINEVGSLTLTEVAEGFNITKEQAEGWGKILESHGLIELNYPAVGELQLCKKKSKNIE